MYRFLLSRRWVGLHLLVLALIPAFFFLGKWQWGRFEENSARSTRITANLAAAPVPIDRLDRPGGAVPEKDGHRLVTATGRYDPAHELVVRRRTLNARVGFYVVTPLVTPGGAVLVNRGWVPAGATADAPPRVPAPPAGEVTVTGRLRPAETRENSGIRVRAGLPAGQILLIDTSAVAGGLPYPVYGGFVELTDQRPPAGASPSSCRRRTWAPAAGSTSRTPCSGGCSSGSRWAAGSCSSAGRPAICGRPGTPGRTLRRTLRRPPFPRTRQTR